MCVVCVILLLIAIASIFACHGECGSTGHGGMMTYVHFKLYIPIYITYTLFFIVINLISIILIQLSKFKSYNKLQNME